MLHSFKNFILEDTPEKPNKETFPEKKPEQYLSHLEDAIIDHGHEGVNLVANYLDDAHKLLTGHKAKNSYQVKYDGGSQIMFGIHPETQQFFIASKSSPKDKDYKISHTKEDVKERHGDKSEFTIAFYHLPKILPKDVKPGEFYEGDIMHTSKDIRNKNKHIHFRPNSITYSSPSDSSEGSTAKKSKLGIVIHTKHKQDGTDIPIDKKERSRFIPHPDVHNVDPELKIEP